MKVYFSLNKEVSSFKANIKQIFNEAANLIGVSQNISATVALAGDRKIKQLNTKYRNVNRVTDVLSFPMLNSLSEINAEADFAFGQCHVGDIYINLNRAKQQATEYGHSLMREVCFLALHGFLHLMGYDHITKQQEKEMFKMQDIIMKKVNLTRED